MKIDLHVHASERSGCSVAGEEEIIRAAIGFGLDALAFSDHQLLVPPERLAELNAKFAPFRIFSGIEIHTVEEEDVLVIGVSDPRIEKRAWTYPALFDFVRDRAGFLAVAHPFRYRDTVNLDFQERVPDALEVSSFNIRPEREPLIRSLAERLGCRLMCSSDAHSTDIVGICRLDVEGEPADNAALVRLLKGGRYRLDADAGRLAKVRAGV